MTDLFGVVSGGGCGPGVILKNLSNVSTSDVPFPLSNGHYH